MLVKAPFAQALYSCSNTRSAWHLGSRVKQILIVVMLSASGIMRGIPGPMQRLLVFLGLLLVR